MNTVKIVVFMKKTMLMMMAIGSKSGGVVTPTLVPLLRRNKMVNIEEVNIEETVEDFIKDLQWELRDSYNSSSCLGPKQRDFLKEKLYGLLRVLRKNRKE